jgi:hypothetical protein
LNRKIPTYVASKAAQGRRHNGLHLTLNKAQEEHVARTDVMGWVDAVNGLR